MTLVKFSYFSYARAEALDVLQSGLLSTKAISQYCKGNIVGTCSRMNRGFDSINKILFGKADGFSTLVITLTRL